MFSLMKSNVYVTAMLALAVIGVFAPDLGTFLASSSDTRFLATDEEQGSRALQVPAGAPTRPPGTDFSCGPGQMAYTMNWSDVTLNPALPSQTLTMSNGLQVTLTVSKTGDAVIDQYSQFTDGNIVFGLTTIPKQGDLITPNVVGNPSYPTSYITMDISFDRDLLGLLISIGDVDSTSIGTDAVRIRMFDNLGNPTPLSFTSTGTITVNGDFGYEIEPAKAVQNPGFEASLYAKANGFVRSIKLDQSLFVYLQGEVGKEFTFKRGVFPALGK